MGHSRSDWRSFALQIVATQSSNGVAKLANGNPESNTRTKQIARISDRPTIQDSTTDNRKLIRRHKKAQPSRPMIPLAALSARLQLKRQKDCSHPLPAIRPGRPPSGDIWLLR